LFVTAFLVFLAAEPVILSAETFEEYGNAPGGNRKNSAETAGTATATAAE